jgi:integrase
VESFHRSFRGNRHVSTRRKSIPSYVLHKQSGRGRVVWYDSAGTRRQRLLPGAFNSPESRTALARFQLELETSPVAAVSDPTGLTLAELLSAYLDHALRHYRGSDGKPTSEIYEVKVVIRALRELYADTPVAEFGPLALKAARQRWVNEDRARTECNRRVGIAKRIFKWAVSEELAPPEVYQAIATVTGLQKGRTSARETEPVGPVDDVVVDATLPHLNRHVRGLIEFQRLTGCRPGEACSVRLCDIETGGPVWLYRPPHHKNAHRGKFRTVAIGPKAQEVLKGFFTPDLATYLFSPARAVAERLAERAANRQTPRWPSHMTRNASKRKARPKRTPSERYDRGSYGLAIDRGCDKAFTPPGELAQRDDETRSQWWSRLTPAQRSDMDAWRKSHRWHPNQLRHTFATRIRKQHGLEAAQVLLGHSRADVTQVYAERDQSLAITVAAALG